MDAYECFVQEHNHEVKSGLLNEIESQILPSDLQQCRNVMHSMFILYNSNIGPHRSAMECGVDEFLCLFCIYCLNKSQMTKIYVGDLLNACCACIVTECNHLWKCFPLVQISPRDFILSQCSQMHPIFVRYLPQCLNGY